MGARLNIVVIEDNDDLREATVEALRLRGHDAQGFDSAEALSDRWFRQRIDVLVVDLNLPGEDGLALAARVRATEPGAGIIMVTARNRPADKLSGYETGADIYMTKPVALDELCAAIQSLSRRLPAAVAADQGLRLDLHRGHLLCPPDGVVELSAVESALLGALARAAQARLQTWQLVEILGKRHAEDPKAALEVTIVRLRNKLRHAGCTSLGIKSIRNWGYQLVGSLQLG